MPCPEIIGQFKDSQDPNLFCIAMEDLTVEYNPLKSINGIGKQDAMQLIEYASSMHAHYWESEEIKADWLNVKDAQGQVLPVAYDGWWKIFAS